MKSENILCHYKSNRQIWQYLWDVEIENYQEESPMVDRSSRIMCGNGIIKQNTEQEQNCNCVEWWDQIQEHEPDDHPLSGYVVDPIQRKILSHDPPKCVLMNRCDLGLICVCVHVLNSLITNELTPQGCHLLKQEPVTVHTMKTVRDDLNSWTDSVGIYQWISW